MVWEEEEINKNSSYIQAQRNMARRSVELVEKLSAKKEERQCAIEKPKLDIAHELRGIYYVDPNDMAFKDTMKHARKKLEVRMESARPCTSRSTSGSTSLKPPKDTSEIAHDTQDGDTHYRKGIQFFESLQSCAQAYFHAPSNENSRRKSRSRHRVK